MDGSLKLTLTNADGEVLWQWTLPAEQARYVKKTADRSYAAAVARLIEDVLPVEEADYE